MTSSNIRGQSGTNRKKNKRGQGFESTRKRKEAIRIKEGFSEDYHKEMEQRRKESEAKKKKKTTTPTTTPKNKKTTPKDKTPKTTPKTTEGKTPKKTEEKTPKTTPKKTEEKTPKTTPKKTENKDKVKIPKEGDAKKKDPKKDNGRLTDNKASDFLDGVKNPSKGEKPKKKPKKRLSAREKMRKKNEARFGKAHVDKLRNKTADFKKMKRGGMTKAEFIKKYPRSITAQKAAGIRR